MSVESVVKVLDVCESVVKVLEVCERWSYLHFSLFLS